MAPELQRNQHVSFKIDVFSFGCIVNEIFSGKKCFHDMPKSHAILDDELAYYREHTPTIGENFPEGMFSCSFVLCLSKLSG